MAQTAQKAGGIKSLEATMPERVNDSLQVEILFTRLQARRLADSLPPCEKRLEIYNTILACDLMLKHLKSATVTDKHVSEMRLAYEGWKRSKGQSQLGPS